MAAGKSGHKWAKPGKTGSDPVFPGSFGGYEKRRSRPSGYSTTSQQHKIGGAGREVGAKCKGKAGSDFKQCRHEVMKRAFGLTA